MTAPAGPLLGAHISSAGSMERAFERAAEYGAECLQIFTRAPSRWKGRDLPEEEVERFRQVRHASGDPIVIAHDLYLTNLAALDPEVRQRSLDSQVEEMERCAVLGLDALVCHLGSCGKEPEEVGLRRLSDGVREVLERTEGNPVRLLLETTAGQGSCLGHRFEHLARVIEDNGASPRLGVCVDTCHVYAAGYDLVGEEAYEATWAEFDRILGRDRLVALHLNDSKKPLGSRVDRHTHIGHGELGQDPFRRLVRDSRLAGIPMFLETPDSETMLRKNLDRLKSYRRKR